MKHQEISKANIWSWRNKNYRNFIIIFSNESEEDGLNHNSTRRLSKQSPLDEIKDRNSRSHTKLSMKP
jgi:hypothetical protein